MTDTGKAVIELSANALKVLQRRYLKKGENGEVLETPEEMFRRVARAIAQAERLYNPAAPVEEWEETFYQLMTSLEFLPNSPTLMNAGRELGQLSACFVLPVGDSMESIFEAIKNTALIHKSGGGTGFSFSRVRPHNDVVHSTKGVSSGPLSFMSVFDAATETIKQGGTRRGANMGILRVDHPDILDFITAKQDDDRLNNFNISVAVTDAFMRAVEADEEYALVNPRSGETVRTLSARKVFKSMVTLAWKNGEPGIVFIDRINEDNPTPQLGEIESTNPCGEQPLLPYESCNLGSINLSQGRPRRAHRLRRPGPHRAHRRPLPRRRHRRQPLPAARDRADDQGQPQDRPRRHGLRRHAAAPAACPTTRTRPAASAGEVMSFIHDEARAESEDLARERGVFPNFEGSIFDTPAGARVRNATVTTIAPTGHDQHHRRLLERHRAALRAQLRARQRPRRRPHGRGPPLLRAGGRGARLLQRRAHEEDRRDAAPRGTPTACRRTCSRSSPRRTTSRPSGTSSCRRPSRRAPTTPSPRRSTSPTRPPSTTSRTSTAWPSAAGCKGVTIYRDGSRDEQVLNVGQTKKKREPEPGLGIATTRPARPQLLTGETQRMDTGCGKLFVIMNDDEYGPREVFANMGKAGGCASSNTEALGRLISLALKKGASAQEVVEQLKGIRCHVPYGMGPNATLSCADAIGKAIERRYVTGAAAQAGSAPEPQLSLVEVAQGACPDCGGAIEHEGGCAVCRTCGYSKCG